MGRVHSLSSNHSATFARTQKTFPFSPWKMAITIAGLGIAILHLTQSGLFFGNPNVISIRRDQIPPSDLPPLSCPARDRLFSDPASCPTYCTPPDWLAPYRGKERVKTPSIPMRSQESFMMHPQNVFLKNGNGYLLDGQALRKNHKSRLEKVKQVNRALETDPEFQSRIAQVRKTDEKGFGMKQAAEIILSGTDRSHSSKIRNEPVCLFSVNPQKIENYKKAGKRLAKMFKKLPSLSEKEICKELRLTHRALFKGIKYSSSEEGEKPGSYRFHPSIVQKNIQNRGNKDQLELINETIQARGSKEDVRIFQEEIAPLLRQGHWTQKNWTPQQMKVFELYGYMAPDAVDIPLLMEQFAKKLKLGAIQMTQCEDVDPVGFAAWAQMELGKIHPFANGNGRLSRLLGNTFLRQGGYEPIVFPDEKQRGKAILKDGKIPGYFADFLRKRVIPWNEKQFDPSLPCLEEFTC